MKITLNINKSEKSLMCCMDMTGATSLVHKDWNQQ
ncbi:hypothetical protein SCARR_03108 [Pontiella sulfatireligans]|uniref:Uncharacterized protein n=1 Tax=Pontiella sulfatireligans TaxID=2750658 RepID=A0A6C2UM35_9BACT|nr:hypothetical protein SCARR_03108 [Pontiella sulfatireligans]